jgi:hypothetical protein
LGYCLSLINKEFPWVHIIKGEVQKPNTQGSVEVSHHFFGRPNTASYSAVLGKAYKVGQTEYGLRLAKCVLEQSKKQNSGKVFSQEDMEKVIKYGDEIWEMVESDPDADSSELLNVLFYGMLGELKISLGENDEVLCDAEDMLDLDKMHPGNWMTCHNFHSMKGIHMNHTVFITVFSCT